MNSGEPYSPERRGPPRQAYQYVFLLPSASVTVVQCSPLALIRILPFRFFRLFAQPAFNFIGRHWLSTAVFDDDADAARGVNVEPLDLQSGHERRFAQAGGYNSLEEIWPARSPFFLFWLMRCWRHGGPPASFEGDHRRWCALRPALSRLGLCAPFLTSALLLCIIFCSSAT